MDAGDEPGAMGALVRLYRREAVTLEEAQAAARALTGDPDFVFPPPEPVERDERATEERAPDKPEEQGSQRSPE